MHLLSTRLVIYIYMYVCVYIYIYMIHFIPKNSMEYVIIIPILIRTKKLRLREVKNLARVIQLKCGKGWI